MNDHNLNLNFLTWKKKKRKYNNNEKEEEKCISMCATVVLKWTNQDK